MQIPSEADGLPGRSTLQGSAALLSLPLLGPQQLKPPQPAQGSDQGHHQVAINPPEEVCANPTVTLRPPQNDPSYLPQCGRSSSLLRASWPHGLRRIPSSRMERSPRLQPPWAPGLRKSPGTAKSRGGAVPVSSRLAPRDSLSQAGGRERWRGCHVVSDPPDTHL